MVGRMVQLLKRIWFLAYWGILAASLIGFLGKYSRWFDHFSSFRMQYLLLSMAFLIYFSVKKQLVGMAISLGILLLNAWFVAPWLDYSKIGKGSKVDFRIFHANVLFKNLNYSLVTEQIRKEKPDFISINEATPVLINYFRKTFTKDYPYTFYVVAKNNTQVLVGSQTPFVVDSVASFAVKGIIKLTTLVKGKPLTIIACHAYNPLDLRDFEMRNQQLKQIAQFVKREANPIVVVGDLNITPWSVFYQDFIGESDLLNCQKGFGLHATWPVLFLPMRIPIDHCLINNQLETADFRAGHDVNSDHLPLVIDLRFTISSVR
jgi:endonuclease/exonuclease/phosphatase (EEP) superfamily protein YafD